MNSNRALSWVIVSIVMMFFSAFVVISIISFIILIFLVPLINAILNSMSIGFLLSSTLVIPMTILNLILRLQEKKRGKFWCPEYYDVSDKGIRIKFKYSKYDKFFTWKNIKDIKNFKPAKFVRVALPLQTFKDPFGGSLYIREFWISFNKNEYKTIIKRWRTNKDREEHH